MLHHTHRELSARDALLVFDFDGTLCLGDAPAIAYAHEVEELAGVDGVVDALTRFLGDVDDERGVDESFANCDDPYDVVTIASAQQGVSDAQRSAAYLRSRAAAAGLEVHAPEGLHDFLDELHSTLVLVTNAPEDGLDGLLETLGLTGRFAEIVTSAGKPLGMAEYLAPHHERGRPILSVGDKWVNDLAPAAELGATTALIDSYGLGLPWPADHTARTLPELYPALLAWDARHQIPARTTLA